MGSRNLISRRMAPYCALAAVIFVAELASSAAAAPVDQKIFTAAESTLAQPAQITKQALSGLFTSVTRAGARLVAVGQDGRIIISDDDGKSWTQAKSPTSVTLTSVKFASPTQGWAVGQMGVVLHSTDAGKSWGIQFDGFRENRLLLENSRQDVTAHANSAASAANLQNAQQLVAGGPSLPLLALLPISERNILVAGGFGMAFSSTDGGSSWISIFDQIPNPNGLHIYSITEDGTAQLWAGEEGLAMLRDQQGNFQTLTTPSQGTFFGGLRTPGGALILYGLQGVILRSQTGGSVWDQVADASSGAIDCGIVLGNGDIVLGNEDGSLLVSRDDGKMFRVAKATGPVAALVQAANGAVITAGPLGMHVVAVEQLTAEN